MILLFGIRACLLWTGTFFVSWQSKNWFSDTIRAHPQTCYWMLFGELLSSKKVSLFLEIWSVTVVKLLAGVFWRPASLASQDAFGLFNRTYPAGLRCSHLCFSAVPNSIGLFFCLCESNFEVTNIFAIFREKGLCWFRSVIKNHCPQDSNAKVFTQI